MSSPHKTGLVYVARVVLRNDLAVGATSYATGEFIPYAGYLGGGAIYGHGEIVLDRNRPIKSTGWKVGFTTNLGLRVVALAGESCGPVNVVALRVCARALEVEAHRELRACGAVLAPMGPRGESRYGCVREWYRDSVEFRRWLSRFGASWRGSLVHQRYSNARASVSARELEARLLREVLP